MSIFDKKDLKIVQILSKNSRTSHNSIGKSVELSKNGVTYKIENMIKKGIISDFITIPNIQLLGLHEYEMLIKIINIGNEDKRLIEYLKEHNNIQVIDRISGEWNIVLEMAFKGNDDLNSFIEELFSKFSNIIETYKIYPHFETYKANQLPIDIEEEFEDKIPEKSIDLESINKKSTKIDDIDRKLILELSKNTNQPIYELAKTMHLTSETVANRLKKLLNNHIIIRNSIRLDISKLGYDTHLIILNLKHANIERRKALKNFIQSKNRIRFSFSAANTPKIFIYFASKNTDEIDDFINEIKQNFYDILNGEKLLLLKEQYKYNLFPEGFM